MARTNQGGSVLGFVIVGIVLAGLLIGGIYVIKRSSTQPQSPPPPAQKPQEPQKPAKDPAPPPNHPRETQPAPQALPSGTPPPAGATQLPATGPKEITGTLIVLGLLGAGAAGYLQSRRLQSSL
jgi:LPXTG-motif cell wall-anchored protein